MEGEGLAASWATFAAVPVAACRWLNLVLHAAFQTLPFVPSKAGRRLHAARGMEGEKLATFAVVLLAASRGLDLEPLAATVPQPGLGSQL